MDRTPKILNLTLKKQWFDMILSGEKTEEYRVIKEYWITRLVAYLRRSGFAYLSFAHEHKIKTGDYNEIVYKKYDYIEFVNGYGSNKPRFLIELKDIQVRTGKTEWGAIENEKYFVLILGNIIKVQNIIND